MKSIWHIEIQSDTLLYLYSKLTGTKGNAKAAAFYPFLITTSKVHPKMKPYFINHELIHFAQQKEMFIVGGWIFRLFEYFYILTKGKRGMEAYLSRSTEQEAYDNMFNLDYLKQRKSFSDLKKYWKNKPVIWNEYLKKVLEIEGYSIVYDWYDEPNTKYENHKHQGKVSFFVLEGSVTFFGGINKTVSKGERMDVPVGVEHSAIVGNKGCKYIVGQEIESDA